jgi:hypothetical protein
MLKKYLLSETMTIIAKQSLEVKVFRSYFSDIKFKCCALVYASLVDEDSCQYDK